LSHTGRDALLRGEAAKEAKEDARLEATIGQRISNWKRATVSLGLALLASIAAVVPFLDGHPLHKHWDALGKYIVLLSMFLLSAVCYAAWTTYNMHVYLRDVKEVHQDYKA
jgi:hypothetical protein